MSSLATLAQALGISYASGVSLYATVALVGLLGRTGHIGPLPGALGAVSNWAVIGVAGALFVFEFLATLIPGIASAWETFHTVVRPPAAALLAVLTAWQGDATLVTLAGLLGGGLALTTHGAKLGMRYAIDTSPEPVTNGVANVAELGVVASISYFVWHHPYATLALAIALLVVLVFTVRAIWRAVRRALSRPFARDRATSGA
ncbi:MAG: hypothetical protein AVDCRST_MAG11-1466 [uncultured Gemmatimonadaceae bacterium]|uniref:DUF4126 domain-containing protein n=1 Tax=uncultured Gemmatimonadaceae bacterium TaxID=246130 RepID=A0A6J4KNF5_9BACT|nr:MAG: hypothetical protein AVDCRST_MAG11-1466 [uncultured Gemmatimonadaceae bacterium]